MSSYFLSIRLPGKSPEEILELADYIIEKEYLDTTITQ